MVSKLDALALLTGILTISIIYLTASQVRVHNQPAASDSQVKKNNTRGQSKIEQGISSK